MAGDGRVRSGRATRHNHKLLTHMAVDRPGWSELVLPSFLCGTRGPGPVSFTSDAELVTCPSCTKVLSRRTP